MNRKNFLSAVIPLAANFTESNREYETIESTSQRRIPPYLQKGDTIGITSPAGYISIEDIQPAINKFREWGFEVSIGATIGKQDFTFGGNDNERLQDFQQMLDDKNISAIMCARGGYGAVRIIDKIDFTAFSNHPKWIIGFSDITVLHSHLNRNLGTPSIHSKMCNSFPADWNKATPIQKETIESIHQCLIGENMSYKMQSNPNNKAGTATGILVGGNLKTIESLSGSKSDIHTKHKILFIEDTGEYLYSIDRMLWNLKRSGKLSQLQGLLVGGFKIKPDDEGEAFGKTIEEIVLEKVAEYEYPVGFDFPLGHQPNNFAVKCGMRHQLSIDLNDCTLNEVK